MKKKRYRSLSQESVGSLHWNQFIILSIRHRVYERRNPFGTKWKWMRSPKSTIQIHQVISNLKFWKQQKKRFPVRWILQFNDNDRRTEFKINPPFNEIFFDRGMKFNLNNAWIEMKLYSSTDSITKKNKKQKTVTILYDSQFGNGLESKPAKNNIMLLVIKRIV